MVVRRERHPGAAQRRLQGTRGGHSATKKSQHFSFSLFLAKEFNAEHKKHVRTAVDSRKGLQNNFARCKMTISEFRKFRKFLLKFRNSTNSSDTAVLRRNSENSGNSEIPIGNPDSKLVFFPRCYTTLSSSKNPQFLLTLKLYV